MIAVNQLTNAQDNSHVKEVIQIILWENAQLVTQVSFADNVAKDSINQAHLNASNAQTARGT